jgi:putative flippase GtrA
MIDIFKSKEFLAFLVVGGFAAVVNFASRFAYNEFTSYGNAVIFAYMTGMLTAFALSKLFVFKQTVNSTTRAFLYFTLVNVVAVAQTYAISIGLAEYMFPSIGFEFYPEAVAHAIGVMFPVVTSFIGHKYWSFK